MRRFLIVMLLGFAAPASYSAVVSYADNRAGFLAATGAAAIGALPGSGGTGTVVGSVTFTEVNSVTQTMRFLAYSNEISGNDLGFSGPEDFNMAISGGAYAVGFEMHEPSYAGNSDPVNGCNWTCVDSPFTIEIFSGATSLGIFNYNAPDDGSANVGGPVGFFGLHFSTAFDRVQVRDVNGNVDNEFFGNFLTGNTALATSTVPLPAAAWLLLSGLGGLGVLGRRRKAA